MKFLIRKLDPKIRAALEEDATRENISIQEAIRRVLCEHYDLACDPIAGMRRDDAWTSALTIVVRMTPELFQAIQDDAEETGEYRQRLVHQALESHYTAVGGHPR